MIITPPSFWQGRDYLKWLVAIAVAALGHWGFVLAFGDKHHPTPEPMAMPAVMLEFADFAQSATKVEPITIGLPQEVTQDSIASPAEPEVPTPIESAQTAKVAVEESHVVEKPEMVVEKKQKPTPKPKIKTKVESKVQPKASPKVEPKKVVKQRTEKPSHSDVNSRASAQLNSAPPKGDDSKTAAPSDSNANSKQLAQNWQARVLGKLRRYQSYPSPALENRIEGVVGVEITIDAKGKVLSVDMRRSSRANLLDNEAINIVQRASPLPEPPAEFVKQGKVTFNIPIRFNIKEYRKLRNL